MPYSVRNCELKVVSNRVIAESTHELALELPHDDEILPGQFVHLAVDGAYLRRPISIAGYDGKQKALRLIVQVVGAGTAKLAGYRPGGAITALLPLGKPFPLAEIKEAAGATKEIWLLAGGIGSAPLLFLGKSLKRLGVRIRSFVGFRNQAQVFGVDELESFGEAHLSVGGFVTDIMKSQLKAQRPALIAACGPTPMFRALKPICGEYSLPALVSLEERMGCGVGACLVCNCGIKTEGGIVYRRVCKDGPVFDIEEVVL